MNFHPWSEAEDDDSLVWLHKVPKDNVLGLYIVPEKLRNMRGEPQVPDESRGPVPPGPAPRSARLGRQFGALPREAPRVGPPAP